MKMMKFLGLCLLLVTAGCANMPITPANTNEFSVLQNVNTEFNRSHRYQIPADQSHWKVLKAGESGECSDFALSKYFKLIGMGYSPKSLHLMMLPETSWRSAHLVLVVTISTGENVVLDNMQSGLYSWNPKEYTWYAEWEVTRNTRHIVKVNGKTAIGPLMPL